MGAAQEQGSKKIGIPLIRNHIRAGHNGRIKIQFKFKKQTNTKSDRWLYRIPHVNRDSNGKLFWKHVTNNLMFVYELATYHCEVINKRCRACTTRAKSSLNEFVVLLKRAECRKCKKRARHYVSTNIPDRPLTKEDRGTTFEIQLKDRKGKKEPEIIKLKLIPVQNDNIAASSAAAASRDETQHSEPSGVVTFKKGDRVRTYDGQEGTIVDFDNRCVSPIRVKFGDEKSRKFQLSTGYRKDELTLIPFGL